MNRATVEEMIIGLIAEATVNGGNAAELILKERNINDPVIEYLVTNAVGLLSRESRADDRLRFKILQLDPSHYEEIRQRNAEYQASSKGQSYARKREKIDKEREDRLQKAFAVWGETAKKMETALSFYDKWHLSDGTPLGMANKSKLLFEVARETATAEGHQRNVVFYQSLASKLNDDQTVLEAIPLDEAHKLREQAYAPDTLRSNAA